MSTSAKKQDAPRREPQQERGRAAVSAILAATSELLEEAGFDSLTTIAIAERAGPGDLVVTQDIPLASRVLAQAS